MMNHDPSLDRKRFAIDRPDPGSQITDDNLADGFLGSEQAKMMREFGRYWELPKFVRTYIKTFLWIVSLGDTPLENTVQRVTHIIRSRRAIKAGRTRKKNARRKDKKAAREKKAAEVAERKAKRLATKQAKAATKEAAANRKAELAAKQLKLFE